MKAIFEGSATDIRAVLVDQNASYNEGRAQLRIENLEAELVLLKEQTAFYKKEIEDADRLVASHEKKMTETLNVCHATKAELVVKNSRIAALEAEVQKLQYEVRSLRGKTLESSKIPTLSPMQEAEVEAVFQDTLREHSIKPLVFASAAQEGREITAESLVTTIFTVLGNGNRVGAIKEIRAATGITLFKARDLIDNALRRFGCNTDERGMILSAPSITISEKNT